MKNDRRSFLKKLAFGTAVVVAGSTIKPGKATARNRKTDGNEILYRETPAFRDYYRSLKS
ncbi:MAG: twin-arginine translocation signal domain-containing protein [Xanthomonadaceae bacterium]|nr:twin-arginine translocation signal domain-containing protein [Xanthomonadaceae bacterium]